MAALLVAWMPIAGGAELTLAPEGGRVRVSVGALGEFTVGAPRLLEAGTLELAGSGARYRGARFIHLNAARGGNTAPFDLGQDLSPTGSLGQFFELPADGGWLQEVRALLTRSGVEGSTATLRLRRDGPGGEVLAEAPDFTVPEQGEARLRLAAPVPPGRFYLELTEKHGGCYWWGCKTDPFADGQAFIDGVAQPATDFRFEYALADVGTLDWSIAADGERLTCTVAVSDHAIAENEPPLAVSFGWERDGYDTSDSETTPFRYLFTDTGYWFPVHAFKRLESDWSLERRCEWARLRGTRGYDLRVTPKTGRLLPRMQAGRLDLLIADGGTIDIVPESDELPAHFPRFFSSDPELDPVLNEFLLTFLTSHTSCPSSYEWDALKLAWVGGPIHDSLERVILHYTHRIDPDGYIWSRGESRGWDGRDCSDFDSRHYDSNAPFILACWRWYCWTGDEAFLAKCIDTVRKGTDYLLEAMDGRSGVLTIESPNHTGSGVPGEESLPSDYWDCIPAGYRVAYINAFYAPALRASAELERAAGNEARAAELEALAGTAVEAFNETFWDGEKGRYIGWLDSSGKPHDFGMTHVNTIAATYGLASTEQVRRMYRWMENEPTESGEADTFTRWVFAPRSNTIHCHEQANRYAYDEWCEDGGAILWTAFYEIMSRAEHLGADNAYRRFREILGRFAEPDHLVGGNPYYRGETNNHGDGPGSIGTWGEFPESGIVPCAWLYAFMGLSADLGGLHIRPNLPGGLKFAGVDGLVYRGRRLRITVWRDRAVIAEGGRTVRLPIERQATVPLD